MIQNILNLSLVLGSASPRRQQLMSDAGFHFRTLKATGEEHFPDNLKSSAIPEYLSRQKALELQALTEPHEILITADTIVWINNQVLNKPSGKEDAMAMLRLLSGNSHEVFTGVCLTSKKRSHVFSVKTEVEFKLLESDEINYYVEHYRPYDKAGAYGAQDWLGITSISRINGSYFNVMGLPVKELIDNLKLFL